MKKKEQTIIIGLICLIILVVIIVVVIGFNKSNTKKNEPTATPTPSATPVVQTGLTEEDFQKMNPEEIALALVKENYKEQNVTYQAEKKQDGTYLVHLIKDQKEIGYYEVNPTTRSYKQTMTLSSTEKKISGSID